MIRKTISRILVVLFVFGLAVDAEAQRKKKKNKKGKTTQVVKPKPKPKPKKGDILPYGKVVTKDMKTDDGLFKVHSKDDKYLLEIPDTLMEREMLMVTRLPKLQVTLVMVVKTQTIRS